MPAMQDNKIKVTIWGITVGKLYWDVLQERAVFNYDQQFINNGVNISPLMNTIEETAIQGRPILGNRDKLYKGLPEFIADSLPDTWGNLVFEHWAAKNKIPINKTNAVDKLMFIGKRAMGALEFEPDIEGLCDIKDVRIDELYKLSEEIFESRSQLTIDPKEDLTLQSLYEIGTSAGGMRPKAIIAINKTTGKISSGQINMGSDYKYFILKFGNKEDFPYSQIEYTYYKMATMAGINMMPSQLLEVGGIKHFLTERYDRQEGEKVHVLTFAAIKPDCNSYEELFDTAFELKLPSDEICQLYRRMVFNIFAGNVDDHTKNFSFMMNKSGNWYITPAYDLMFTVNINGMQHENWHMLSLCGKKREINTNDLIEFAQRYAIKSPTKIINEVAEAVSNFRLLAEKIGVKDYWVDKIEQYLQSLVPISYRISMNGYKSTNFEEYQSAEGYKISGYSLTENEKHDFRIVVHIDDKRYRYTIGHNKELADKINQLGRHKMSMDNIKQLIYDIFLKDRKLQNVSDIQIYRSLTNDDYFITCKIDGEQQISEKLTAPEKEKIKNILCWENTNEIEKIKHELAEKYFVNSNGEKISHFLTR